MSAQLAETLRGLLTQRKEEKLKNRWPEMPEAVFCTEDESPLDVDYLRYRVFYQLLGKAELRRVRFHDLRRTFSSSLIQDKQSLAYVKEQLGRASIQLANDPQARRNR
jgi:integrase